MTRLEKIIRKKERFVIGLMSGTSIDSIDAVLVKIRGGGESVKLRQLAFHTHKYPKGLKEFVLNNSKPGHGRIDDISTLNILIAHLFSDAVLALIKKAGISSSKIDLIGAHGQTIHHMPRSRSLFGKHIRSTLQIGDPSTIAKLTGIVTVGNFRTGDMALGGQGAPLVPYLDYIAYRSFKHHRALLNIGGIANITLLKKKCGVNEVTAFDTGPGNMVIDALMHRYFRQPFDHQGSVAASGKILPSVLKKLIGHPYFSRPLPKSTGREEFGDTFVKKILQLSGGMRKKDMIATVTELTAVTIYEQFNRFARKTLNGDLLQELIISGGGSKNRTLVSALEKLFFPTRITDGDEVGIPSDSKEAVCFALLANETICGHASNIPSVTGARAKTVLGQICE